MNCPKCKSEKIKVIEKRDVEGEQLIRRRRECEACGFRFTTYERLEVASLVVIKKDKSRQPFLREKLGDGIRKALEKRPISEVQINDFISSLEEDLRAQGKTEIESKEIGDLVLKRLKTLDDVAYLRFASVYKSFDDIASFKKELDNIS